MPRCKLLVLLGALVILGWAYPAVGPARPTVSSPVWVIDNGKNFDEYEQCCWEIEAAKRFNVNNTVFYVSHGGWDNLGWYVTTTGGARLCTAVEKMTILHRQFPDKTILMIVCNPLHEQPKSMPRGVFYATDNVWMLPDAFVAPQPPLTVWQQLLNSILVGAGHQPTYRETEPNKGWVGSIWEFQEGTAK